MALRKVVTEGDAVLRKRSKEVREINDRILTLLDDMWETLAAYNGVGLAAPQVGVLRRVAVIDTGEEGVKLELINPRLTASEGIAEDEEGCLSVPGIVGNVRRPAKVTVEALDRRGEPFSLEGEGLTAKAVCHEIDHLDGILFTDKAEDIRPVED
jgi:peptide deformylase